MVCSFVLKKAKPSFLLLSAPTVAHPVGAVFLLCDVVSVGSLATGGRGPLNSESLSFMQVVEVVRVFCEGFQNTPLPAMYSYFLGKDGIKMSSVAKLYEDLQRAQLMSMNGEAMAELDKLGLGGTIVAAMAGAKAKQA